MKIRKIGIVCFALCLLTCGCTHLTRQEEMQLQQLKGYGVTIDRPIGSFEPPASPAGAAALNILPGIGNFYLAAGNGADSSHTLYGVLNFLLWPLSVLWGVPEAAVDTNTINKREMLYYYQYDPQGKVELNRAGIRLYR